MADCTKTIEFSSELNRLCAEKYQDNFCSDTCPFYKIERLACPSYANITQEHIDILQKWSDENPVPKPKTYADDFFEKFPEASKVGGMPAVCRANIYGTTCQGFKGNVIDLGANDCLLCWKEVIPE